MEIADECIVTSNNEKSKQHEKNNINANDLTELKKPEQKSINISYDEAYGTGFEDMQKRVPDITKIKNELNWLPQRKIDQIITDVVNFQRQN